MEEGEYRTGTDQILPRGSCARCVQRINRGEGEAINRETAAQGAPSTVSPDVEAILAGSSFSTPANNRRH